MAKRVNEDLVCDVCGTTTGVQPWTLVNDNGAAVVDLCPGDAKPVQRLWDMGSTEPRKRQTGPKRPQGHAVIPVD